MPMVSRRHPLSGSPDVCAGPAGPSRGKDHSGGIQVIARAAAILRVLEHRPDGQSLGQIAKAAGLSRSTVQRIVAALAMENFVTTTGPNPGVRIGAGLIGIAAAVGSNTVALLRPHLRALSKEVCETVDLAVLSGGSAVFVDQVPGRQRLVAMSAVGERFPLHCTANGKAILACMVEADVLELIDKSTAEHPDHPLTDHNALMHELGRTRQTHLAFDFGRAPPRHHGGGHGAARLVRQADRDFRSHPLVAFCRSAGPNRGEPFAFPRAYQGRPAALSGSPAKPMG